MGGNIITLYHGSIHEFDNVDVLRGKPYKDFGVGLYTSKVRSHAADLAKRNQQIEYRRTKLHNLETAPSAWIYTYEFDLNALRTLKVKEFKTADSDWVKFIVLNRTSKKQRHDYDIVIGPTANDQTLVTIQAYLAGLYGNLDDDRAIQTFLELIEPQKLPAQIYFGSQTAADLLVFKERSRL
jgi:hypothetical protein